MRLLLAESLAGAPGPRRSCGTNPVVFWAYAKLPFWLEVIASACSLALPSCRIHDYSNFLSVIIDNPAALSWTGNQSQGTLLKK